MVGSDDIPADVMNLRASIVESRDGQSHEWMVKTSVDADRYRLIIDAVAPRLIIETGTFNGRSALWFQRQAPEATVITIDIDGVARVTEPVYEAAHRLGVRFYDGDSVQWGPRLQAQFGEDRNYQPVLVSLDSDHTASHVYAEMVAYAPLVTVGSYLVVEDTIVRYLPDEFIHYGNSSPWDAVDQFLNERDDFVVDTGVEALHDTTQFPSGWLRRTRR